MNPVVHFEMPAEDKDRMKKFYETVFNWKTEQLGKEMGEYVVVHTSETDKKGMVKTPGTINGGFYTKTPEMGNIGTSVVISVDNINDSIAKVKKAGGKVKHEPMPIPGIGLFVSFLDTEGNRVTMLQPTPRS